MPSCLVLDFNDPRIRIESNFFRKALFDRLLGDRLNRRRREHTLHGPAVVVYGLRRGGVKHRIAVEQRQLDENGTCLIRSTAAHRPENALALATAQIGSDPNTRLQPHGHEDTRFVTARPVQLAHSCGEVEQAYVRSTTLRRLSAYGGSARA